MTSRSTAPACESAPADLVRAYYRAWSRDDLDAMLVRAHPDIVATPTLGILYERGCYEGHDGIAAWVHEVERAWDSFDPQVGRVLERDGQVIAFIRLVARRAGTDFDARFAVFHELRDGRIVRLNGRDLFETVEELGVPEAEVDALYA
jgi:ketosteroid isomerase-like protein